MPLFGAHLSVSGGPKNAIVRARALNCDCVQIFTKNPNQWIAPPLAEGAVAAFREAVSESPVSVLASHDSYLINLAAADEKVFERSVSAFVVELERAEALGLHFVVTHPGSHVGSGEAVGLKRVIQGYDEVHARCPGVRVRTLIETTAGQGTALGYNFEQIATILRGTASGDRMGVCFDTCHVFAAGYGLVTAEEYSDTFQRFDEAIGLSKLELFHVNDSAKPFGSRIDRHAHIGQGEIGPEAFRRLVNDPRFAGHPMILETPKNAQPDADMDHINLGVLRGFLT
jgi:deoxyribonuclease-4